VSDERIPPPPHDDVYARSAFFRCLALAAALLAWTFDGVEQGVYSVMTRDALKDLIPKISDEVKELKALNAAIEQKKLAAQPAEAELAQSKTVAKEIDTEIGHYFGLALAMWLWGAAAGGVIFGRLGDRFGRVKPLMAAVVTYSIFTGLSAFSAHWTQFAACRFLGALGLGGAWPLSVALMVETWPDRYRSVLAGLMGAGANVGFLIAATYSRYMGSHGYDWRWTIGIGFFIGVSSLVVIAFVPETTKYRLAKEKAKRARLADLFSRPYRRATIVGSLLSTVGLLGTWGSFLWLATYVDQIAEGTEFAKTARGAVSQWQSYGQILGGFTGGLIASWLGTRRSWCFLCVTAWAAVVALFGLNNVFGMQMIAMAFTAGVFVTAFFGWLPKFLPELYPTHIRASGQGFSFNIGRILAGFGVLGTGSLVAAFGGNYQKGAMVMASIYAVGLLVIWFAPDTGGKMRADDEDARST
jgi:MFS transporter, SHS family, sialic acid transporter